MPRILMTLGILAMILLATTFCFGLVVGNTDDMTTSAHRTNMRWHFLLGTSSALAVVFVHSVAVTYFIGTTRWCKEVAESYPLSPDRVQRANRYKRKSFPWSLAAMLVVVAIIALGAAADPATGRRNLEPWAMAHLVSAMLGGTFVCYSFYVAWCNVVAQNRLIDEVVGEVREIRKEKGLDTENLLPEAQS